MADEQALALGQRVVHSQFGDGVVVGFAPGGHVRVFFGTGERQVPAGSLRTAVAWTDRVLAGLESTPGRLREVWLALEAQALPLLESAAALTAARVDLLPHQIVLTHHVASGSPRRLLVADEVGLGKTIETALILRELASRGELRRALMIVPAGLVSNWHRELNEVFNLHFEVFGVEGDVTDRRSNAFAKHDRLIASVDTLKRPARIRRLLEAPPWDLIVFDEAHHLTALRTGGKVRKTANYKLAEALRSQVLGQLAERLSYDRLYQEALSDPELHRTRLELEAALANASEARRVVFDLFQDLDGFRLDDYQPFSDVAAGIDRVVRFLERAARTAGHQLVRLEDGILELRSSDGVVAARFTRDRDEARSREDVAPVGLDHPVVEKLLTHWRELAAEQRAVAIERPGGQSGVQTWWLVEAHREAGDRRLVLLPLAVSTSGARLPSWEKQGIALLEGHPAQPVLDLVARRRLLAERIEPMLGEELRHRGLVSSTGSYTTKLVAWVEVVPGD